MGGGYTFDLPLVPGALALASKYFGNPAYMDTAKETARYLYEHDLAKGYCGGGPAEILEAPDSESSCELGESYIALWELTGEKEWVEKAKAAAAMYASWVEAFDYPFPKTSRMGKLGIKATGSVWASVQNRHSAPGPYVMSADWLVKLSQAAGDSRYAQVFYDTALNIAQYATTEKNHFMPKANPGTLTERVNTCDWEGRGRIGGVGDRDSNQAWENVALFTLMALEKNTLYRPREINATWCSLGTSITWYNSNVDNARGKFTRSYQDRVLDVLRFKWFINRGVNGGVVASQHGKISKADYYTMRSTRRRRSSSARPARAMASASTSRRRSRCPRTATICASMPRPCARSRRRRASPSPTSTPTAARSRSSPTFRLTWRSIPTIPATSAWQTRSSRLSIRFSQSHNSRTQREGRACRGQNGAVSMKPPPNR